MGQLVAQLFHGQVCAIPSLSHLQGADKRSRVNFKCAICIWNLLLSTLNMRSKELSLSVKQAIIRLKNQSPDLNPIDHSFHLLKTKLKGKCPKNKQELKTVAAEAWQSITRDETQRLVMSMRSRLQAVIDCKGFATKY